MEFNELIEARRSVRRFVASPIAETELAAIVSDALNAPSWKNTEVTRYYAACEDGLKARIWRETLPDFNVMSTAHAAALVAVTYRKGESGYMGEVPANELGETWGAYDAGLASAYFILAARNRGWDSLILGIRDAAALRRVFNIPENEIVVSVIALGKSERPPLKPARKSVEAVLKMGR